jgi:hypothetical protein
MSKHLSQYVVVGLSMQNYGLYSPFFLQIPQWLAAIRTYNLGLAPKEASNRHAMEKHNEG